MPVSQHNKPDNQLTPFAAQMPPINALIKVVLSTNAAYIGIVLGFSPQHDPKSMQLGVLGEGERHAVKSISIGKAAGYSLMGTPGDNRDGMYVGTNKVWRLYKGKLVSPTFNPETVESPEQPAQSDTQPVLFSNSIPADRPSSSSSAASNSPAKTIILRPAARVPQTFQDSAASNGSVSNNLTGAATSRFALTPSPMATQNSGFTYARNSTSPIFLPLNIKNNVFNMRSSSAGLNERNLSPAPAKESPKPKEIPDLTLAYTSYKNAVEGLAEIIEASTKNIEVFRKQVDNAMTQLHKEFSNLTSDQVDEVLTKDIRQLLDNTHAQLLDSREKLVRSKAMPNGDYTPKEMTSRLHSDLSKSAKDAQDSKEEVISVKRQKQTHHMS